MRWLVTGAGGMLGHDLRDALSGCDVTALTRADLDISRPEAVEAAVAGHDVVVNAAAWTAVDDAEDHEAEAFAANAVGPAILARACARAGARLVHVSTDYVFSGVANEPYAEESMPVPDSAYGRTKAAGEWAVRALLPDRSLVVRTAWLYGEHGRNFVATVLRLAREREELDIVDDQTGQPTWSHDLAQRLVALVETGVQAGIYHGTNSGQTTWYGLARRVLELSGQDPQRVRPIASARFPGAARRPEWSVLGHAGWARVGLAAMRPWDDALSEALPHVLAAQDRAAASRL